MNIGNVIDNLYIAVNSAVECEVRRIGIDVFVASVVNGNLDKIFRRRKEVRDIETECRITAHMRTDGVTVNRNIALAVYAVKFNIDLAGIFADNLCIGADTSVIRRGCALSV